MELCIIKQDALYLEKLTKNGGSKDVHYVVKNTPFVIQYNIKNWSEGANFNFNKCKVDCTLLYDMNPPKDVDYISKKPMEYVIHPSKVGNDCSIEFRVKVLTTQLEGSLFLIKTKLIGYDGSVLELNSRPIKTVSKPEQIRRKMAQTGVKETLKSTPSRKKRTRSDELLDILQNIQTDQKQQGEMLNNVVGYLMNMGMCFNSDITGQLTNTINNAPVNNTNINIIQGNNSSLMMEDGNQNLLKNDGEEFEIAFNNLMTAYNKLNPDIRPTKMKKMMQRNKDSLELQEMVSIYGSIQTEPIQNSC